MGLATAITHRPDATGSLEPSARAKVQAACNFLNAESARLRHQTITAAIVFAIAALVLVIATAFDTNIIFVVAAGAIALAFVRAHAEMQSSNRIAAKRIVGMSPGQLKYNPKSSLTRQQFAAMDLFTDECEGWKSRDEIAGRAIGARYSLHQARATGRAGRTTIFEGIIVKIDFDGGVPAHTVILPASEGRVLSISNGASASRRKKDFVMLKNPAFERMFDVYSTDYFEAKQLVTPRFMRVVLEAQELLESQLRLCFTNRSLYIAVPGQALRLESALFAEPLTPQKAVGKLPYLLWCVEAIAELRA